MGDEIGLQFGDLSVVGVHHNVYGAKSGRKAQKLLEGRGLYQYTPLSVACDRYLGETVIRIDLGMEPCGNHTNSFGVPKGLHIKKSFRQQRAGVFLMITGAHDHVHPGLDVGRLETL